AVRRPAAPAGSVRPRRRVGAETRRRGVYRRLPATARPRRAGDSRLLPEPLRQFGGDVAQPEAGSPGWLTQLTCRVLAPLAPEYGGEGGRTDAAGWRMRSTDATDLAV